MYAKVLKTYLLHFQFLIGILSILAKQVLKLSCESPTDKDLDYSWNFQIINDSIIIF